MADMKKYLISFQATLSGHKMVMSSLSRMDKEVRKVTDTTKKAGKQQQNFQNQLMKAAKRALIVAPVWMAIRWAMMKVIRTFQDMAKAFIDLDDQLARIRTVMHGTAEDINVEMIAIKRQIIDTSLKSRISIKDLAEGFYFLKTANLDATEAMAAFTPTVNLSIGTMNSMAESARAVAGIYNTMGIYLGENLTVHEKFQHISDVLAYTYATQDVQLSELIQSYTKLAPYITGLSDSFLELTTMLGFLNTRLLRAGRTGRLTGRAILQLTKNAKKLAGILDITFDPDAPIAFLETIGKIRDAMKIAGKLTSEQGDIIQQVFATRAGVVIRLLIEHWEDLSEQIKDAIENVDGFGKKMKEIRMDTIAGQMAKMKNILAVLMDDFLSTAHGAKNLAGFIKLLNANLIATRSIVQGHGKIWAAMGEDYRVFEYKIRGVIQALKEVPLAERFGAFPGMPSLRVYKRAAELTREMYATDVKGTQEAQKAREEYLKTEEKINTLKLEQSGLYEEITKIASSDKPVKQKEKEIKKIQEEIDLKQKLIEEMLPAEIKLVNLKKKATEDVNEIEEEVLGRRNKQIQQDKHLLKMMKIRGASALDIAKEEEKILQLYLGEAINLEDELELLKLRNKVTEEEFKYRQEMVSVLQKTELDMLKIAGASELQILEVKERQLEADRKSKGETQYLLELGKLRTQQQQALGKEKQKENQRLESIAMSYGKADEFERTRVRRAAELAQLGKEDLASRYRSSMADRKIIDDYISYFDEQQKQAIARMAHKIYRMPGEFKEIKLETGAENYWKTWISLGTPAVDTLSKRFENNMVVAWRNISGQLMMTNKVRPPTGVAPQGAYPGAGMPTFGRTSIGVSPTPSPTKDLWTNTWKIVTAEGLVIKGAMGALEATMGELMTVVREEIEQIREEGEKNRDKLNEVINAQDKTTKVTEEAF